MSKKPRRHKVNGTSMTLPKYAAPTVRLMLVREAPGAYAQRVVIKDAHAAYRAVREALEILPHERFVALLLDAKNRLLSVAHIADGGITGCPVDPRILFAAALLAGANAVIVAHNHPSGDCQPSPEDFALTKKLAQAGVTIGVRVADHIVVGSGEFYSMQDHQPSLLFGQRA